MSEPAVRAELQLTLKDGATAGLKSITDAAEKSAKKVAEASADAAKKSASETEASTSRQRSSYEKLSRAREVLGVRSERMIQREIQQTEAAYKRLESSGQASSEALARAADKTREKITKLTNEMGKLTAEQKKAAQAAAEFEKVQSRIRTGVAMGAGVAAAAYTLKAPAVEAMSYDRRLAHMANTAYNERDEAGYQIGKRQLEAAVNKARKEGGGTREQAAEALDMMLSSGTVSDSDAIKMLPGIMKGATSSNTDASALAMIAIRAKQSFKISADDFSSTLSAALAGGQAGGFELKDMSKWLPQQMAMAGNLGLSGKEGFAKLVAWNQASVITSGTKDEAGNNLRDLLMELNTPHFRKFIGDQLLGNGRAAKKGEKEQRKKGIDAIFLDYQSRGIDKVTATMDLAEKIFAKDKTYAALQTKLRATDKNDKAGQREIIEAMAAQVQGTQVGNIFHNQQSLMAFLGLMNNKQYTSDVLGKVRSQYSAPEDKSAIAVAYRHIAETPDYMVEQAKEDTRVAQKSAMDGLTPTIGKVASAFSDLASKHPLLVGTTALATTALGALAGAAGLASLAMGGGKGGAIANAAIKYGSSAGKLLKVGGIAGTAAVAGDYALEKGFGEGSAISRYGSSMLNGAAAGAMIGSIVPVLGTGIGAALGFGLGGIYEALKPAEQPKMKADVNVSVTDDRVLVKSTKLDATGMIANLNTGNMWSTP